MKKSWVADAYSRISLWRRIRVPGNNILLLLPRCLQHDECTEKVSHAISECSRCGRCNLKEIADLETRYGIQVLIASGGRQAVAAARNPNVKMIVAVACAKELMLGIFGVFPKPVLAVYNGQTNGPCVNTRVDVNQLKQTLKKVIAHE